MSGRHEPPTNRSFYLSVATGTLRAVIVVALVVGGVVLLNRAFPEGGTGTLPKPSGVPSSETPTPTTSPKKPKPTASPQVVGVRIGVFNGAGVTGLASDTAATLERKFGYDAVQITDAPGQVAQTELFYRSAADKIEAQELARLFFKGLDVKIAKLAATATNVDRPVQVAVYLGIDYAQAQ